MESGTWPARSKERKARETNIEKAKIQQSFQGVRLLWIFILEEIIVNMIISVPSSGLLPTKFKK